MNDPANQFIIDGDQMERGSLSVSYEHQNRQNVESSLIRKCEKETGRSMGKREQEAIRVFRKDTGVPKCGKQSLET